MKPKILLVNPPIYDFTAYNFWLKPYGLLTVAGFLRNKANFQLFDFLDSLHPFVADHPKLKPDIWSKGRFYEQIVPHPPVLLNIPRYFRRFGLPQNLFTDFLTKNTPADFTFIQTTMTYWYLGIAEVIKDIRCYWPKTKIILGGNYVTICLDHAKTLNADLLIEGANLEELWEFTNLNPNLNQPPLWECYKKLNTGVLKLTNGCPLNCTYCAIHKTYKKFTHRPLHHCLTELQLLITQDVKNIAFYDDALLFEPQKTLVPFLNEVIKLQPNINFHTPNALNARFLTQPLADLMVKAGFKTFYLGFESISQNWQKKTGRKVRSDELAQAVKHLTSAGADPLNITAYNILGHPYIDTQQLEDSMHFVNNLGIYGTLADFSPIPDTPDGEHCRKWVDLDEPLLHNKATFPVILLGFDQSNRLKDLQRKLNRNL